MEEFRIFEEETTLIIGKVGMYEIIENETDYTLFISAPIVGINTQESYTTKEDAITRVYSFDRTNRNR